MPNTLAHFGIQGLLTRWVYTKTDLKWLYIGCILPDLPWILQRVIRAVYPGIDRYDLLLYAGVQSSLFFCLILSLSLALLTRRVGSTFFVLTLSCSLHLLLDATQVKWANGVILFAPVSWQLTSMDIYWPEALPTHFLTVFGLGYVVFFWRKAVTSVRWSFPGNSLAAAGAAVLAITYFVAPPVFMKGLYNTDNYYVATLQNKEERVNKNIAFDRAYLSVDDEGARVRNFNHEWFQLEGLEGLEEEEKTSLVSLKGRFLAKDRIQVTAYHLHPLKARAFASMLGLALILFLWLNVLIKPLREKVRLSGP